MCRSNSPAQVCGIPLSTYTTKEKAGIKPTIIFYSTIRGAIVHALFDRVTHGAHTSPSPPFAAEIITTRAFAKVLLAHCNLDFLNQDNTGRYRRLVIPAWKSTVKYIQRKVIEFGVITKVPGGWARDQAYVFTSDEHAGKWFNDTLGRLQMWHKTDSAKPALDQDEFPDLASLSLREVDNSTALDKRAVYQHGALPDLVRVSLGDVDQSTTGQIMKGIPARQKQVKRL